MASQTPPEQPRGWPRSLIWRVALFSAAAIGVIVAFTIAYYAGAFAPR